MASERRGLLLGAAAYLCWGLLSPGNEILLRQYTPLWMQAVRGLAASLVLVLWLGRRPLRRALAAYRDPALLLALLFGTFVSFALFAFAQTRLPAAFTTLGFYTAPLWTALFGAVLLRERMGWTFGPAVAAILGGGYLALTGGGSLPWPDPWGLALAVGSGLSWGLYAVLLRRYGERADWQALLLASTLLGGSLFLLGAILFEPLPAVAAFSAETWVWTAVQVAIPTVAALGLFQSSLRYAPAAHINLLVGLELAATLVFAALFLGARFTGSQLVGLALVLGAISAYLWSRSRTATARTASG